MRLIRNPKWPTFEYIMDFEKELKYLAKNNLKFISREVLIEYFNTNPEFKKQREKNAIYLYRPIDGKDDIMKKITSDIVKDTYARGTVTELNRREIKFKFSLYKVEVFEFIKTSEIHLNNIFLEFNGKKFIINSARLALFLKEGE